MKSDTDSLLHNLTTFDGGLFLLDASEAFAQLNKTCRERGKKGSFAIFMKIKPNASGRFEIKTTFKTEPPKPEEYISVMYCNDDGHLVRRDPRQPELPGLSSEEVEPKARPEPKLSVVAGGA